MGEDIPITNFFSGFENLSGILRHLEAELSILGCLKLHF
jgi:hypothetical protein